MYIMRQKNPNNIANKVGGLSIRYLLGFWLSILLGACGGDGLKLADNGVGGTGITQGRITHLDEGIASSITVNNIKFNTHNALLIRDGVPTSRQSDFNVGEIVTVKGALQANSKQGVASEVVFDDTLEGPVTASAGSTSNSVEILGQTVVTDSKTLFYGFDQLADLKKGYVVEVSGYINEQQQILASTLRLVKTTLTVGEILKVEGHIDSLNIESKTFKINNLTVDYSTLSIDEAKLRESTYVLVRTQQPIENDVMLASDIDIIDSKLDANTFYQKDGYITTPVLQDRLEMEGSTVLIQLDTEYINGSKKDLVVGKHLIVTGKTNSQGELLADQIYVVDRQTQILLEGFLEKVDTIQKKVNLFDTDILIDEATRTIKSRSGDGAMLDIDLGQLQVGDYIYVEAYHKNGNYYAFEIIKTQPQIDNRVMSVVQSTDETKGIINLFSHKVLVDENTQLFDVNSKPVSKKEFFKLLKKNQTLLDAYGSQTNSNTLIANAIFIDTSW